MTSFATTYTGKFNALSFRERLLLASASLVVLCFGWWYLYAQPSMAKLEMQQTENNRISTEVYASRAAITEIRSRIAAGVHREKEQNLAQIEQQLQRVEDDLRLKTIELIDPEDMFGLMNRMIYSDSRLKLISLMRREVRPAIAVEEDEQQEGPGVYRHVLEVKFSGKYADMLSYMQTLEKLDWKLIWDEIEIVSNDHPLITVKLVISTLSTREEWVGV